MAKGEHTAQVLSVWGNTKRCDSGTQEEKCLERKHELLDNIGVFEVKVS